VPQTLWGGATQIAAHYGGLNCFRRLLPRGSEGEIAETPQINMTVIQATADVDLLVFKLKAKELIHTALYQCRLLK